MKKTVMVFLFILCWVCHYSPVFAYSKAEQEGATYHEEPVYFIKSFYDMNVYDQKFEYKKAAIVIKVLVVNNSDSGRWFNQTIQTMINEGVAAGWRRADYIYFLEELLTQAIREHDEPQKQILHSLISYS